MYAYCLAKTVNKRKRVKLENDENDLKDLLILILHVAEKEVPRFSLSVPHIHANL